MKNATQTEAGQATLEIETKDINKGKGLYALMREIRWANPKTRDAAASIVRDNGFQCHVGGHHVAVLRGTERVAIITASGFSDWN